MESSAPNLPEGDEENEEREVRYQGSKEYEAKIHVLMETETLDKGGLEQVVYNLAKGLNQALFKVVIVAIEKGGMIAHRCKESVSPWKFCSKIRRGSIKRS